MKFLTYQTQGRETYGVVKGDGVVDLGARLGQRCADLKSFIASGAFVQAQTIAQNSAPDHDLTDIAFLPPIGKPDKILCVGVNYVNRNAEYKDGSEPPKYPSLFMRTPGSLVGHKQNIVKPPESDQLDYEGEIVIVIGKSGRRIPEREAPSHIFGLTCMNDGSVRDWLRHGKFNVTQGKNFEKSGSVGPWIAPCDEIGSLGELELLTRINGEERQRGNTGNLLFPFTRLLSYISTFIELQPGDMIATGTPPGAGARFDPPRYLKDGDHIEIELKGLGILKNNVINEPL